MFLKRTLLVISFLCILETLNCEEVEKGDLILFTIKFSFTIKKVLPLLKKLQKKRVKIKTLLFCDFVIRYV